MAAPTRARWRRAGTPTYPSADSLGRRWVHHWADQCARRSPVAAGGTARRDERYALADYRRPSVVVQRRDAAAPRRRRRPRDGLLDEIDGRFRRGLRRIYLWSLWPTPDLRARGWELEGHPPLLIRPPATAVLAPVRSPRPTRRIAGAQPAGARRVGTATPCRATRCAELHRSGRYALAGPALLDDERLRLWISRDERGRARERVGAVRRAGASASLAFGVTLPEARRRGQWSLHARHRLRAEPELWHAGVFSDFSRPGAERLGFIPVIRFTLYRRAR